MDDKSDEGRFRAAAAWVQATPVEAAGLVVLLVGTLLAAALVWWQATQRPSSLPDTAALAGEELTAVGTGVPPTTASDADVMDDVPPVPTAAAPVVVHVTGAVRHPGVVTLPHGARVADAIAAAGGGTAEARTHLLNLARPLQDGQHVHLPRDGEPPLPGGGDGTRTPTAVDGADAAARVDLNRASAEELQTLPGIGPTRAMAIVEHRRTHGPFTAPGDLRAVPGIGEKTFQGLADRVTVS